MLKTVFLLLYENFLFTFYYIFVIEYGAVIIVVIFRTKVFIMVKQFANWQIILDFFLQVFKKLYSRRYVELRIPFLKKFLKKFSENGVKILPQTHIKKFQILQISPKNKIHCTKLIPYWNIKFFKFLDASLGSVFCSKLRKCC